VVPFGHNVPDLKIAEEPGIVENILHYTLYNPIGTCIKMFNVCKSNIFSYCDV
jgi:hypothetical protein